MSFDPQKFFIGLIDFFSIWLPGALLTYVIQPCVQPALLRFGYAEPSGLQGWVVFLIVSYMLGHFIFLVGAVVLDPLYDALAKHVRELQEAAGKRKEEKPEQGAKGRWYEPPLRAIVKRYRDTVMWFYGQLLGDNLYATYAVAGGIPVAHLGDEAAAKAVGTFKWCRARLAIGYSEALAIVDRYEADSKFFRSLFVVLLLLVPWAIFIYRDPVLWAIAALIPLSAWRFLEQRAKATVFLYVLAITLEGEGWPAAPAARLKPE